MVAAASLGWMGRRDVCARTSGAAPPRSRTRDVRQAPVRGWQAYPPERPGTGAVTGARRRVLIPVVVAAARAGRSRSGREGRTAGATPLSETAERFPAAILSPCRRTVHGVETAQRALRRPAVASRRGCLVAVGLVVALLAAGAAGAGSLPPPVAPDEMLVVSTSGAFRVLDGEGSTLRRLVRVRPVPDAQALALAPDRRHAWVVRTHAEAAWQLLEIDLASGRARRIADAAAVALAPDRRRVAFVAAEVVEDIDYRTALVIRAVDGTVSRRIPFPARAVVGTPPENVISWSPDGRSVALFDGSLVRLVDTRTGTAVARAPTLPGGRAFAPVFLDERTLIVQTSCCVGPQHLVETSLDGRVRRPFATLTAPVETVWRRSPGSLAVVTALHELVIVRRGSTRLVARDVLVAAG